MATSKSTRGGGTSGRGTTRKTKTTSASTSAGSSSRRSADRRLISAVKDRPVASAAIGTGLLTGIVAAVAGFLAFKKSGKSFGEFSDDVATSVKVKAAEAGEFVKDGLADAKAKAQDLTGRTKDGIGEERSQSEIAEEALTLKETGATPAIPSSNQEAKAGFKAYN